MYLKQGKVPFLVFVIAMLWGIDKDSISHDNPSLVL